MAKNTFVIATVTYTNYMQRWVYILVLLVFVVCEKGTNLPYNYNTLTK